MPPASPRQHAAVDLQGLTVLAIEDHADSLEMLTEALRMLGATVLPARSSQEGFEMLQQHQPQLVISDIGLPDEDGCSLMRRIRQLSVAQGGATPAIALSAFSRAEDRKQALAAGFHVYLTKPMELSQLVNAITVLAPPRN
jgi:diguanylate cyclase